MHYIIRGQIRRVKRKTSDWYEIEVIEGFSKEKILLPKNKIRTLYDEEGIDRTIRTTRSNLSSIERQFRREKDHFLRENLSKQINSLRNELHNLEYLKETKSGLIGRHIRIEIH